MSFADFPNFTVMKLEHKEEFQALVSKYPPLSDLSFSTLMVWWNFKRDLLVSVLNNNLVIRYHLPGDKQNSGYSLVGTNQVDESLYALFNEIKLQNKSVRAVHVPEFTVRAIAHPEKFEITNEEDYAEYLVPVSNLFPLDSIDEERRYKITKFLRCTTDDILSVDELDLSRIENQKLILQAAESWREQFGSPNDLRGDETIALRQSIKKAQALDMKNICLFINNELAGFCIYQISHDHKYIIGNHLKARRDIPRIFSYLEYLTAEKAHDLGISLLNVEMDLGIEGLRSHKQSLRPTGSFKKYRITPLS